MCGCPAPGPGSRVTRRESQTGINAALDFSGSLTMGALGDRRNRAPLLSCGRGFFFFASAGSPATPRTGGLCREDSHAPPVPVTWSPHSRNPCAPATQHKRRERGGSNPFRRRSLLERSVHRWQIFRSAADTYGRSETQN
jgi:hypothetical protein